MAASLYRPMKTTAYHLSMEPIVHQHSRIIAAAVRRVCAPHFESLIPDVTQEVHVRLWQVLKNGRKIRNIDSYTYRVAFTTALSMVEKARKQRILAARLEIESAPEELRTECRQERVRLANELLARLDADRSKALRAYLAGYNHTEIAKMFGWSESSARHKIYRSLKKLQALMH